MKTKDLFLGMAVFMLAFGFTSCASNGTGDDLPRYGDTTTRAVVELTGNPTTGYAWVCSITPGGIVKEISSEYIPDQTGPGVVGAGGKYIFTFEAIKEGEAELLFSYLRPWEENVSALQTETWHAIVDSRGFLLLTM